MKKYLFRALYLALLPPAIALNWLDRAATTAVIRIGEIGFSPESTRVD